MNKIFSYKYLISFIYLAIIFTCYFLIPWIINGTLYFFRWDEAAYLYIFEKIAETGYIPTQMNYIGGISNYIYPNLYLILSNIHMAYSQTLDLQVASLSIQAILLLTLVFSSILIFKIVSLITKNQTASFLAGLFYIILPIASYRLFYLHATFYANFVGMLFLLSFVFYLLKYTLEPKLSYFVLSILFFSITLFTHQLVFMMAVVILGIHFLIETALTRNILKQIGEKILYFLFAGILNIGYLIKIPLLQKLLNILGLVEYSKFGKEVVQKSSAEALPPIVPDIILLLSIAGIITVIAHKRYRRLYPIALFHLFLLSPHILSKINIHLPASFRYDSFYIITIPILLSVFLMYINNIKVTVFMTIFLILVFATHFTSIYNGFSIPELTSLRTGLQNLQCHNTVSYFRIAPWIPVLSQSSVYYAHVDIYNAHTDRMNNSMGMFSYKEDMQERLSLMQKEKVDCLVYEKHTLVIDGKRVKGWEPYKYQNLYPVSDNVFEDKNLVIFNIKL